MSFLTLDGPMGLIAEAVLKGTLFLLLLFVAAPLLRRFSAGTRHLVWGMGLVALTLLPFLSRVVPWRIGIIPTIAAAPVAAPTTLQQGGPAGTPKRSRAPSGAGPSTAGPVTVETRNAVTPAAP